MAQKDDGHSPDFCQPVYALHIIAGSHRHSAKELCQRAVVGQLHIYIKNDDQTSRYWFSDATDKIAIMSAEPHVVIIGYVINYPSCSATLTKFSAGVVGLTNAVFLAEAGYTVTVIAAHVPGDSSVEYTSPWYLQSVPAGQVSHC